MSARFIIDKFSKNLYAQFLLTRLFTRRNSITELTLIHIQIEEEKKINGGAKKEFKQTMLAL